MQLFTQILSLATIYYAVGFLKSFYVNACFEYNVLIAICCYKFMRRERCFPYQHICFLWQVNGNCIIHPLFYFSWKPGSSKWNLMLVLLQTCNVGKILSPIWDIFKNINFPWYPIFYNIFYNIMSWILTNIIPYFF